MNKPTKLSIVTIIAVGIIIVGSYFYKLGTEMERIVGDEYAIDHGLVE